MKKWYGNSFRLGMIGGGQLGRMFIQEAANLDVHVHVLDNDENSPCKQIASSFTKGSITDFDTVYQFGKDKELITVEIENVSIEALEQLESEGKKVFPQPRILKMIRDKGLQKAFYVNNGIPTSPFYLINSKNEISTDPQVYPFVQKMRTGGYDGKGVQILKKVEDLSKAFDAPSVIEQLIPFEKELSVIVARNERGESVAYPSVECQFNEEANLVELLFTPAQISEDIDRKAQKLALELIESLDLVGILAVEFFLTKEGDLLVNEIAPRPHNSGHHTIECNSTSQFAQHLRSILNLPLGDTSIRTAGGMINLLGEQEYSGEVIYDGLEDVLAMEGVFPHIYGKVETKAFRKMGHVTITAASVELVLDKAERVKALIKVIGERRNN
ncbi:MAG: 5-(carboxyamino)imidazole ribonucleotide synthase [Bacteroidota bacterium]